MEDKQFVVDNSVSVIKDTSGQKWFVGIYSNNFEDKQGEILTWDAHLEYAKWVRDTGVELPITVLHQPQYSPQVHLAQFVGLATGKLTAKEFSDNYMALYKPYAFAQSKAVIPLNGFVLVIAKILKSKEHVAELISKSSWKMSHGFFALDRDETTYNLYRTYEFTSLPEEVAANSITLSNVQELKMDDVMKGFSEEHREILQTVLTATDADELDAATQKAHDILSTVLNSKSTEITEEEEVVEPEMSYEDIRTKMFVDMNLEGLQKAFVDLGTALSDLHQRLDTFEGRIEHTEKTDDEKIAEQFSAPSWLLAEKSDGEELSDDEKEALRSTALADNALPGTEEKSAGGDPVAWTFQQLVPGLK